MGNEIFSTPNLRLSRKSSENEFDETKMMPSNDGYSHGSRFK